MPSGRCVLANRPAARHSTSWSYSTRPLVVLCSDVKKQDDPLQALCERCRIHTDATRNVIHVGSAPATRTDQRELAPIRPVATDPKW